MLPDLAMPVALGKGQESSEIPDLRRYLVGCHPAD